MEKVIDVLRSKRLNKLEIEQTANYVAEEEERINGLLQLTQEEDLVLSWHAWWVCDHLAKQDPTIFEKHRESIISILLQSNHEGKQRLMLNVLMNTIDQENVSVPLLNFCFDNMLSPRKSVAVQACCMKLAYQLSLKEPELLPELKATLENAEPSFLTPATQSALRKILKELSKRKK